MRVESVSALAPLGITAISLIEQNSNLGCVLRRDRDVDTGWVCVCACRHTHPCVPPVRLLLAIPFSSRMTGRLLHMRISCLLNNFGSVFQRNPL